MIRKYVLIFIVFSFTVGICMLFAQETDAPAADLNTNIENIDTASAESIDTRSTNVVRRVVLDKDFLEAERHFFDKKYYLARRAFLKYLDENPLSTNDMLYYYLASTYFIDKDYKNAIDYYKIALDLNGTPFHYNNVANSYYQMKAYPDALAWYKRSIDRIENASVFNIAEDIVQTNYVQTNYITNIAVLDISVYKSLADKYLDIESLSKNIDSQQSLTTVGNASASVDEAALNNSVKTDADVAADIETATDINANDNEGGELGTDVQVQPTPSDTTPTSASSITSTTTIPAINLSSASDFRDKMETISDILINRIENEMFLSQTNIFVNTYYTNMVTNFISVTNWTAEFSGGSNNTADETGSGNESSSAEGNTSSSTITPSSMSSAELNIYYSPYLHTANTYLKLGQYKEAQIYYEVFLTNVGGGYYQYDNISKMIEQLKNVEITNRLQIEQQKSLSMVVMTNEIDNSISTVYYSDGEQAIVDTIYENGDSSRLQKYKDGTVVNTISYSDGASVVETSYANGKKEIETIEADGSIVRTSFDIDSTKRIFSTNTVLQGQYSYTEYADGNNITKISDDTKNTTLIERLDASFTKYQLLSDGTKEIYTLNPDGSELYRMEYPDGKVEVSVEYPDGSTVDRINYADNTVQSVSKSVDGSTTFTTIDANGKMTITTTYIDGSMVTRVANQGDGEGSFILTTSTYDEHKNFITTTVEEDGSIKIVTKSPDSTLKTELISTDGTITAEIQKPTGFVDTKTTLPDGATTSVINTALGTTVETLNADGSSQIETTDIEGNITTTTKTIDKTITIDTVNIDGSYEKTILNEDGSGSIDILDKNGNSIQTTLYRNGISKSVVNKENEVKIDAIKSNDERSTVITFTDGTVYQISEVSGTKASLRVDIASTLEELSADLSELETAEAISTVKNILSEPNAHSKDEVFANIKSSLDYSDDYILLLENLSSIDSVYTHEQEGNKILLALEEKLQKESVVEEEQPDTNRDDYIKSLIEALSVMAANEVSQSNEDNEAKEESLQKAEQEAAAQREASIQSLISALETIAQTQALENVESPQSSTENSPTIREEYIEALIKAMETLAASQSGSTSQAQNGGQEDKDAARQTLIEAMEAVEANKETQAQDNSDS